jgi:hypothetical protein
MQFRLLIDMDIVDTLSKFPSARRRRLYAHFRLLQSYPKNSSEAVEPDDEGRSLDISLFENLIIHYWIDIADRHVKILRIAENE